MTETGSFIIILSSLIIFGGLLQFLIAWYSGKWLASRLKHWWGSIISVSISFLLGVSLPIALGIATDELLIEAGLGEPLGGSFYLGLMGNIVVLAAFVSVISVMRTRNAAAVATESTTT